MWAIGNERCMSCIARVYRGSVCIINCMWKGEEYITSPGSDLPNYMQPSRELYRHTIYSTTSMYRTMIRALTILFEHSNRDTRLGTYFTLLTTWLSFLRLEHGCSSKAYVRTLYRSREKTTARNRSADDRRTRSARLGEKTCHPYLYGRIPTPSICLSDKPGEYII